VLELQEEFCSSAVFGCVVQEARSGLSRHSLLASNQFPINALQDHQSFALPREVVFLPGELNPEVSHGSQFKACVVGKQALNDTPQFAFSPHPTAASMDIAPLCVIQLGCAQPLR
jgi:hypothetical protein